MFEPPPPLILTPEENTLGKPLTKAKKKATLCFDDDCDETEKAQDKEPETTTPDPLRAKKKATVNFDESDEVNEKDSEKKECASNSMENIKRHQSTFVKPNHNARQAEKDLLRKSTTLDGAKGLLAFFSLKNLRKLPKTPFT